MYLEGEEAGTGGKRVRRRWVEVQLSKPRATIESDLEQKSW